MIFYPNEECLSCADRVVTEIEKILKNPKKTIENSFLKKYVSVLEEGECTDFLKVCTNEYQLLRKGYPRTMMGTGPILPIFSFKGRLKKKKQLLYYLNLNLFLKIHLHLLLSKKELKVN